jgi:aminopeptidase S
MRTPVSLRCPDMMISKQQAALAWTGALALTLAATSCNGPGTGGTPSADATMIQQVAATVDAFSVRGVMEHLTGVAKAPLAKGEVTIAERGSDEGRHSAALYMKEFFESLSLPTRIIEFTSGNRTGYNVEATLQGQPGGRHLWVTAHLHSVFNAGASDDASGLVSIMMTARALAGKPPRDTIHFVAFDLEEIGLVGSGRYVDTVVADIREREGDDAIIGNLHTDMIGYDPGSNLGTLGSCEKGGDIPAAIRKGASLVRSPIDLREDCLGRSDHKHFWDAGLPAAILTDSSKYDAYPWYHEPGDTADKINYPYLQAMIQATAAATAILAYPAES